MDINTFYGILVAIVISLILMFFQKRKIKTSWKLVVYKIKVIDDYYDNEGEYEEGYIIVYYKTDAGKKGKFRLKKYEFDNNYGWFKKGRSIVKETWQRIYYSRLRMHIRLFTFFIDITT